MTTHCAILENDKDLAAGFEAPSSKWIQEEITPDACGQHLGVAAVKMYAKQEKKWDAWLQGFLDAAPTNATTAAATNSPAAAASATESPTLEAYTALTAVGLMLAVLS